MTIKIDLVSGRLRVRSLADANANGVGEDRGWMDEPYRWNGMMDGWMMDLDGMG